MSSLASTRRATIACYHRYHPQIQTRCAGCPNKGGVIQPVWGVWNVLTREIQLNDILQSIVANDGHHRRMVTALRPAKQTRHKQHGAHQDGSLPILKIIVSLPPCRASHCALLCHTDGVVHGLASRAAAETVSEMSPSRVKKASTSSWHCLPHATRSQFLLPLEHLLSTIIAASFPRSSPCKSGR